MTPNCHPLPRSVAEGMIEAVTRAVCDRPRETYDQHKSRTRQLVHFTLGFEPRDGLEYMLSTLSFTHFNLILDASRDVFRASSDDVKPRSMSAIVALDRALLAYLREYRMQRKRPMELSAEDEQALSAAAPVPDAAANDIQPAPDAALEELVEPAPELVAASEPEQPLPRREAARSAKGVSLGLRDFARGKDDPAHESSGYAAVDAFRAVLDNPPPPDAGNAVWAEHMRQYEAAMIAASDDLAKMGFKVTVNAGAASGD
jgi:hypothetical protein